MVRDIASTILALLLANPAAAMQISSTDILDGSTIAQAQVYSQCGGANISPELSWKGAPKGTGSFVLTMFDESVKPSGWSHWIVVDLPPDTASLARGAKAMPAGAKEIVTNFGNAGYGGPCPPPGTGLHRYRITIWAMKGMSTAIGPDANATAVQGGLEKGSLDKASLVGTLSRQ